MEAIWFNTLSTRSNAYAMGAQGGKIAGKADMGKTGSRRRPAWSNQAERRAAAQRRRPKVKNREHPRHRKGAPRPIVDPRRRSVKV
jgi:hypothetical protein